MGKITLKGAKEGSIVTYSSKQHVELSDGFYEKSDSENVVSVNGRYFRKNSPLIVLLDENYYGKNAYSEKRDSQECFFSGEMYHSGDISSSENLIKYSEGKLIKSEGVVNYKNTGRLANVFLEGGKYKTDISHVDGLLSSGLLRRLSVINYSNSEIFTDGTAVRELHPSYNGRVYYVGLNPVDPRIVTRGGVVKINDHFHVGSSIIWSLDTNGERYRAIKDLSTGFVIDQRENPFKTVSTISEKSLIPKIIKLKSLSSLNDFLCRDIIKSITIDSDFATSSYNTKFGLEVAVKSDASLLDDLYDYIKEFVSPIYKDKILNKIKTRNKLGSLGLEPIPSMYTEINLGNQGGDYVYSMSKKEPVISERSELSDTGGVGYTFGVEIETSFGVVPKFLMNNVGMDSVGDRSIGSMEYVSGILHGNRGMSSIMESIDIISDYCAVDDRCGIHVHVGGSSSTELPVFDKEFSMVAVKLGSHIEEELFSLLPEGRREYTNSNGLAYCGSIKDFSKINEKNWHEKLFRYIYGRSYSPGDDRPLGDIKSMVDNSHRLGRWTAGRYKWLNLVNCLTDNSGRRNGGGGFQTIEFRAFNGTLNKSDIKAFILISLAFTKYVNDFRKEIMSSTCLTIDNMIRSTLNDESLQFLTFWIHKRKESLKILNKSNKTEQAIIG